MALVHYQFEAIHPIRDGNGRVGRLLIPLLLCMYEKIEAPVLYVSPHLELHRSRYTDVLLRVSQKGDFISWIDFFLESVQGSADESTTRAEALLELRQKYHRKLHSARSSTLLLKLVDALFERPSMTLTDATKILGVTPASAGATIAKLSEAGILSEVTGQKRHRRFIAREILVVAHALTTANPSGAGQRTTLAVAIRRQPPKPTKEKRPNLSTRPRYCLVARGRYVRWATRISRSLCWSWWLDGDSHSPPPGPTVRRLQSRSVRPFGLIRRGDSRRRPAS